MLGLLINPSHQFCSFHLHQFLIHLAYVTANYFSNFSLLYFLHFALHFSLVMGVLIPFFMLSSVFYFLYFLQCFFFLIQAPPHQSSFFMVHCLLYKPSVFEKWSIKFGSIAPILKPIPKNLAIKDDARP